MYLFFVSPWIDAVVFENELDDTTMFYMATEQNATSHAAVLDTLESKLVGIKRLHASFRNHPQFKNCEFTIANITKMMADAGAPPINHSTFSLYRTITDRMFRAIIIDSNTSNKTFKCASYLTQESLTGSKASWLKELEKIEPGIEREKRKAIIEITMELAIRMKEFNITRGLSSEKLQSLAYNVEVAINNYQKYLGCLQLLTQTDISTAFNEDFNKKKADLIRGSFLKKANASNLLPSLVKEVETATPSAATTFEEKKTHWEKNISSDYLLPLLASSLKSIKQNLKIQHAPPTPPNPPKPKPASSDSEAEEKEDQDSQPEEKPKEEEEVIDYEKKKAEIAEKIKAQQEKEEKEQAEKENANKDEDEEMEDSENKSYE